MVFVNWNSTIGNYFPVPFVRETANSVFTSLATNKNGTYNCWFTLKMGDKGPNKTVAEYFTVTENKQLAKTYAVFVLLTNLLAVM